MFKIAISESVYYIAWGRFSKYYNLGIIFFLKNIDRQAKLAAVISFYIEYIKHISFIDFLLSTYSSKSKI